MFPKSTILLPEEREVVYWSCIGVLLADIRCFQELYDHDDKWK